MAGVSLQNLISGEVETGARCERLQALEHAGFPIDERAVAVEGEGLEIRQFHHDAFWVSGKTSASTAAVQERYPFRCSHGILAIQRI